jgi:outer membrane murein-binding lipoprotein Lpp
LDHHITADVVHPAALADKERGLDAKISDIATQQIDLAGQSRRLGTKKALDQQVVALQNKAAKLKARVDRGNDFYQWGVDLQDDHELNMTEVDPSPTVMVADE